MEILIIDEMHKMARTRLQRGEEAQSVNMARFKSHAGVSQLSLMQNFPQTITPIFTKDNRRKMNLFVKQVYSQENWLDYLHKYNMNSDLSYRPF